MDNSVLNYPLMKTVRFFYNHQLFSDIFFQANLGVKIAQSNVEVANEAVRVIGDLLPYQA